MQQETDIEWYLRERISVGPVCRNIVHFMKSVHKTLY